MSRHNRSPLDAAALDALALRYVGRYATTRAKLASYLLRKSREYGFIGDPPVEAIVNRMTALGFVDDRAFAESRAASMGRRGYGGRRIVAQLRASGVADDIADDVAPGEDAGFSAAMTFARRRKIGAFSSVAPDSKTQREALAAMLRAGHDFDISRRFATAHPGDVPERD